MEPVLSLHFHMGARMEPSRWVVWSSESCQSILAQVLHDAGIQTQVLTLIQCSSSLPTERRFHPSPLFLEHLHTHEASVELGFRRQDVKKSFFPYGPLLPQHSERVTPSIYFTVTTLCHPGEPRREECHACHFIGVLSRPQNLQLDYLYHGAKTGSGMPQTIVLP